MRSQDSSGWKIQLNFFLVGLDPLPNPSTYIAHTACLIRDAVLYILQNWPYKPLPIGFALVLNPKQRIAVIYVLFRVRNQAYKNSSRTELFSFSHLTTRSILARAPPRPRAGRVSQPPLFREGGILWSRHSQISGLAMPSSSTWQALYSGDFTTSCNTVTCTFHKSTHIMYRKLRPWAALHFKPFWKLWIWQFGIVQPQNH